MAMETTLTCAMWVFTRVLSCGLLVAAVSAAAPAESQTVRVERADGSGSFGHGFVFGDRVSGACRIALPAHVVRTTTKQLVPASLVGLDGKGGAAVGFVQPDPSIDLAFGKVEGLGGQCLSRLPAQSVYESIAAGTRVRLTTSDTASGGVRTMPVRIRDKGLDGHFSVEAVATRAEQNPRILPGYSGALVDVAGGGALGGQDLPLGLILSVCDGEAVAAVDPNDVFNEAIPVNACGEGEYARVLDFDVIRELSTRADENRSEDATHLASWELVDYRASVLSGTSAALSRDDGCFVASPQPGMSAIELNIKLRDSEPLTGVTINLCNQPTSSISVSIGSGEVTYRSLNISDQSTYVGLGLRSPVPFWIKLSSDGEQAIETKRILVRRGN